MFRDQNNHPAHIHCITRSWAEGTGTGTATNDGVSYQRYDGTNDWSTYGGDYAATALGTVTIYKTGAYGWTIRLNVEYDPERRYLWFFTDHLGSTRLITGNDTSDVEQRRDYKPFGDTQTSSGNDESAYQFTQKELDANTGLYYFGARYY